jgi:[glutamine synthetase] adenylyltransferase / [glutamine synthetase]-adenylyl-L-tyrosine phosphorylase
MIDDNSTILRLDDLIDETKAQSILLELGFQDWKKARKIFQRLAGQGRPGLPAVIANLLSILSGAADPDRSLINIERLVDDLGESHLLTLEENPRLVETLIAIFSASPFLTEIVLRTPYALELLNDRQHLSERKTLEQFQAEAISATQLAKGENEKLDALRRYQRQQLLRIGTNDFLGLYDLKTVFSQLSRMAIGLVRACLVLAAEQTGIIPGSFVVLALGKLGGWELNYSSDIDLLFVARKDPQYFQKLGEQLIKNISSTTAEGFLYRVDLRLRPWGQDGPLITTLDAYLSYTHKNARLWEKQAFLKARSIAGNISFGEELRKAVEPYLFSTPVDQVRSGIFAMKQRTEGLLQDSGRLWGEVKLGQGSIRDIEFIVQFLQMTNPGVRTRATLKALVALREHELLTPLEAHTLADGYNFLRTIEHYLQMTDYRQTYTLPTDPNALGLLARRLGFDGKQAGEHFVDRYEQHTRAIRRIFLKYMGNEPAREIENLTQSSPEIMTHVSRMDISYTTAFTPQEIKKHAQLAARLENDKVAIVEVEQLEEANWRITIIGYDAPGVLSIMCGLFFVYGLDIIESQAFTYEPIGSDSMAGIPLTTGSTSRGDSIGRVSADRRKIVDVFTVRSIRREPFTTELWSKYSDELHILLKKVHAGQRREARGDMAKRVAAVFDEISDRNNPLYPIEIEIDNNISARYTVLRIGTHDAAGFLYEFSNALAMNHIDIARVFVQSIGERVNDTLFVTDDRGLKIDSIEKQRELRAATVLIKHFTHLLPHSPNPEAALLHFRELLAQLFDRPNWPDELARLEQPTVLDALARLLGMSDFLWNDFLRMQHSNLFPVVSEIGSLAQKKDNGKLKNELEAVLIPTQDWRVGLNAFKDREMFRIDMRHILGYTPEFWEFSYALTDLVEVVIDSAISRCSAELHQVYGVPNLDKGGACPVTFFALGKCGGRELGFASDIELMLIYAGSGRTSGAKSISNNEFFDELIRLFVSSIQARQEGIFHIDLQLRPYGKAGSLAVSLDAFQNYFASEGPAWAYERQALVKMRPLAGDPELGDMVSQLRDDYVYNPQTFDVTAMQAMRERQIRHLVTAGVFNAKYSPGALVDLEYLVQGLQILHGRDNPVLRSTNTRMAAEALAGAGILSFDDYTRLRKALTFLRWLIDSLRVVRGNSKDVNLPELESEEFAFLARRLRYGADTKRLQADLIRYPMDVLDISQRYLPG